MRLNDTPFQNLMQRRVFNVLLVASPYDAFMMEEDGRVEEQLYNEYVALNPAHHARLAHFRGAGTACRETFRPHHRHARHGHKRDIRRGA